MTTIVLRTPSKLRLNFFLLIGKVIFLILLLLPQIVHSKRRRGKNRGRMITNTYKSLRHECESDISKCGTFILEESEDCVTACMNTICHEKYYSSNPLENGEVDDVRERQFDNCVKEELRREENERRRSSKKI